MTPTQWKVHENKIFVGNSINEADQIIAILDSGDRKLAALVVSCVNTHPVLVEAIEAAVKSFGYGDTDSPLHKQLQNALALARKVGDE